MSANTEPWNGFGESVREVVEHHVWPIFNVKHDIVAYL